MIKRLIYFITDGIWMQQEEDIENKTLRFLLRPFRIIIFTVRSFTEHDISVRAAALTFFTLMSIVPIAALIFGVMKGFGYEVSLTEYLYAQFPQYDLIIDNVLEFANNLLGRTRGGLLASVGFLVLLWAVMKVFGNIEKAFNAIWEIKKHRSLTRKFSDYMTVVFVAPVLWVISNSLIVYVRKGVAVYSGEWLVDILFGALSLGVVWIMFAFIYSVMPNTRVKFKGAMVAGMIAGTAFLIFQVVYVYIQTQVSSYNVIYGSFAAVPLFLLWLQTSWMILLFGAELSFAYQNIAKYQQELESMHICYSKRRKIMLAAMLTIVKHFIEGKGAIDSNMVASQLNLPIRIVRDVIFDLENASLVVAVKSQEDDRINTYIPAKDVHKVMVMDVIDAVESSSVSQNNIEIAGNPEMDAVVEVLDRMVTKAKRSTVNVPLVDLITLTKEEVVE